ncbi:hypothetical protein WJX72_004861 [[Myrmecia] bisecta]|uniref:proteasome endopeptidase complex n=1 Tax=[Myrmecia] bisecta TaxID=41462 RepID=A0AAW1QEZ2_9CHLO
MAQPSWSHTPPDTGTTIVACAYPGGVVLGADSRVSTGTYVSNRASDKLTPLAETAWLLRSGSAADTQLVADYVRYFAQQHSLELGQAPDVSTVARLVQTMNYNNKQMLVGAMIVAGYDKKAGGQVYGCPIGGTLVRENWTTDGSGSTFLWGFLDSAYREDMTREETEELVTNALALAMARDGSSGGVARLVTISAAGTTRRMIKEDALPVGWDELGPAGVIV